MAATADRAPEVAAMEPRPGIDRAVAAVAAGLTALQAALVSGRTHPDEVYQFLEPANRLVFHYGFTAWEWEKGLRNWAVPGALSVGMKLADALGFQGGLGHRLGAALIVALLAVPGYLAMVRYAGRRVGFGLPSYAALALTLAWALSPYFLGRTMGEPIGALLGFAGIEALEDDRPGGRRPFLGGVYLGLAVVVRYPFAALALAVIGQELVRRRWRAVAWGIAGGALVAALLGGLDWATWGEPFRSMIEYLKFNLGPGAARKFGSNPTDFFLVKTWWWLPWPLLLALPRFDLRRDRTLVPSVVYIALLTVTAHKEERFLFPAVLWITAGLAPAAVDVLRSLFRGSAGAKALGGLGLAGYLGCSAAVLQALPDLEGDLFRAVMTAGNDPAMTGLLITNESRWGCPGNVYLARNIEIRYTGPGYPGFFETLRDPAVNRVVLFRGVGESDCMQFGYRVVERWGTTLLMAR